MSTQLHPVFLGSWLVGLGVLIGVTPCTGQIPESDTVASAEPDSVRPIPTDTLQVPAPGQATGDSIQPARRDTIAGANGPADSASRATDTLQAAGPAQATADSIQRVRKDSLQRAEQTPGAPVDSTLIAACADSANGAPGLARDLLLVVFAPAAEAAERTAIARSVGASLVGPAAGGGAYYLRVSTGGDGDQLNAVADRLILLEGVQQVGTQACPRPSTRTDTVRPK